MAFNVSTLMQKCLRDTDRRWTVGDWVLAVASASMAIEGLTHSTKAAPIRWLEKLAIAFGKTGNIPSPLSSDVLKKFPVDFWENPSYLGECLQAARRVQLNEEEKDKTKTGRSGRVSTGVVYTPAPVAREIIAEIFRNRIEDKNQRIIDPACGAGVFLLEAFLKSFRHRAEKMSGSKTTDFERVAAAATQALSLDIGGIDIDVEALAIAEFSLRMLAFRVSGLDRDVPILLRSANTLESLPEFEGQCQTLVGNPPYLEGRGLSENALKFLRKRFYSARDGKVNLFAVFIERSLELACKGGQISLVVPATFLRNERYLNLRDLLLRHTIEAIVPLDALTFDNRVVETVVLRIRKNPPVSLSEVFIKNGTMLQSQLSIGPMKRFGVDISPMVRKQIEEMDRRGVPLGDYFDVRDGISTGYQPFPLRLLGRVETVEVVETVKVATACEQKFFIASDSTRVPFDDRKHHRVIDGCEFNCFTPVTWAGRYIEHDKRHEHHPPHPGRGFNCQLREAEIYDRDEKIISRQTALGLIATVDRQKYFVRNSVHVTTVKAEKSEMGLSLDALCAMMNSEFYKRYLLALTGEVGASFPQVHIADIRRLPILPELLKANAAQTEETLASLGRKLLDMHAEPRLQQDEICVAKAAIEALLNTAFGGSIKRVCSFSSI